MATLHLQTDLLSSFHAHQHPSAASTAARSHPNEADYAAVTPTAARPHPEKGYTSLFDAFVPPQYAFEHARESYRAAQRPTSSSSGQEASTMGGHEGMAAFSSGADNMDMLHHHYQPAAHSSLSSSGSEVSTTGGPATPPSGPALSGRASPASSFASVPGNTIYSSTGIHYEQLQQFHPALQGYSQPNIGAAMVANTHPAGYQIQQQHCSQQDNAVYPYNAPIYGHLQYPSYTPAYNVSPFDIPSPPRSSIRGVPTRQENAILRHDLVCIFSLNFC